VILDRYARFDDSVTTFLAGDRMDTETNQPGVAQAGIGSIEVVA